MSLAAVYVTFPDMDTARRVSRELVEKSYVACANIFTQVTSIYEWEGKIEEDAEVILIGKTRMRDVPKVIAAVTELHPDDVPCVTAMPVLKANPPYAEWVEEICARSDEGEA
jgi:periplasmic divalent cation tolerance protein